VKAITFSTPVSYSAATAALNKNTTMWRRAWDRPGSREPAISSPMLFETTLDEGYLETIPEVESLRSRASSVGVLPELPLYARTPLH